MFTYTSRFGVGALLVVSWLGTGSGGWAQQQVFNPYAPINPAGNPYAPGTTNPYTPNNPGSLVDPTNPYMPYNSYPPPYTIESPQGAVLRGTADIMRAYGSVINSQELARVVREQALQARLETQRKKFDLEMYIKANTPTFTDEQAKVARNILKRIQSNSNPAEIASGKSLNYLLDDVRKYPTAKIALEPITLSDGILDRLNVTKSFGNVGVLRNKGKISWPIALEEVLSAEQQRNVNTQAEVLYKDALDGKVDANRLKDLRIEMDKVRDILSKKVNDIPAMQYLEAKRFLADFDEARVGIERGDVPAQVNFQKFASGGKPVQEVVTYMVNNGLKFAPAVYGDEDAYRALYSALVAFDVALNTQLTGPADVKEYAP